MNHFTVAPLARKDLQAIWDYIGVENSSPDAAGRLLKWFFDKFALLASQPLLGQLREDLRPGLRIFSAESYVILYYPTKGGIEVVGVVHGAQDIEAMFRVGER